MSRLLFSLMVLVLMGMSASVHGQDIKEMPKKIKAVKSFEKMKEARVGSYIIMSSEEWRKISVTGSSGVSNNNYTSWGPTSDQMYYWVFTPENLKERITFVGNGKAICKKEFSLQTNDVLILKRGKWGTTFSWGRAGWAIY